MIGSALALLTIFAASCGRGAPNIVIGWQSTTEQSVVGEIVAQHLESRLGYRVNRRPNMEGTLVAYQALQSGEVNIYPEYSGAIVTEILKEQPASVPDQVFERAKGEMARIAQAQLIGPLGVDNSFVAVIRAADPHAASISTLGEAAQIADGWKLAYSYKFQQQSDTMPAVTQYHLPMSIPMRAMDAAGLFKSMEGGVSTMIIARATDGQLRSKGWKVLADDRNLFTPQQLCLVVRQDLLKTEPRLAAALAELSGKFTNAKMRDLNAQVDIDHKTAAEAAKSFLASIR